MMTLFINGNTLNGQLYKKFFEYIINKSDSFSYEILKNYDKLIDEDDRKYYNNVKKAEKIFDAHFKYKNKDERSCFKSEVWLDCNEVKNFLLNKASVYHWNYPDDIENLCFYKKGDCIFESVTHEDLFLLRINDAIELEKLKKIGIEVVDVVK